MRPANAIMMSLGLLLTGTTAAVTHVGSRTTGPPDPTNPPSSRSESVAFQWPLLGTLEMGQTFLEPSATEAVALLRLHAGEVTGREPASSSVVIALDVSGSMSGDKLRDAKAAAQALIRQLPSRDRVTVLSFADDAVVHMTDKALATHRADAIAEVGNIGVRGTTCVSCALEASYRVLADAVGVSKRLILLTDGQANRGVQVRSGLAELTERARRDGVVTTTIGLGAGYDAALLRALASAGAGQYYFAHNAQAIAQILESQRREMGGTVLTDLHVELRGVRGAVVDQGWGLGQEGLRALGRLRVGAMRGQSERRWLVRLRLPKGLEGEVLRANVRFKDLDGRARQITLTASVQRSTDPERVARSRSAKVTGEVARIHQLRRVSEALAAKDSGREAEAVRILDDAARQLERAERETGDGTLGEESRRVRKLRAKLQRFGVGTKELEATKRIQGARAAEILGGVPASKSFHRDGMYDEEKTQ